jgi:phosphoribosylanthranilate isomerase
MSSMLIKVCGMLNHQEFRRIDRDFHCDYIGMIFYPNSPRCFLGNSFNLNAHAKKVGVFVDESEQEIRSKMEDFQLDAVQLHGNESPKMCGSLKSVRTVFKAISISSREDLDSLDIYEGKVDYFLFDTKSPLKGGTGLKFDWEILKLYSLETPFFLSGGLSANDAKTLNELQLPNLVGFDLNSRFETSPGIKNIELLNQFKYELSL